MLSRSERAGQKADCGYFAEGGHREIDGRAPRSNNRWIAERSEAVMQLQTRSKAARSRINSPLPADSEVLTAMTSGTARPSA